MHDVDAATDLDSIEAALAAATRQLGFDYFALVQRVAAPLPASPILLSDLPQAWRERLAHEDYYVHDPVLVACDRVTEPFSWDDLPRLIAMTPEHHAYMAMAASYGLDRGYTVPLNVPGEPPGLCSFILGSDRPLPERSLSAAQQIAHAAFDAARRLVALPGALPHPR